MSTDSPVDTRAPGQSTIQPPKTIDINFNKPGLSIEQQEFVISAIVSSFDAEYAKLIDAKVANLISDKFIGLYYNIDAATFFTSLSLKSIAETVCGDAALLMFMLNVTDRVSLLITPFDQAGSNVIAELIAASVKRNRLTSSSSLSLINTAAYDSLYVDYNVLKTTIDHNFWLAVLYLLLMFFTRTESFQQLWSKS